MTYEPLRELERTYELAWQDASHLDPDRFVMPSSRSKLYEAYLDKVLHARSGTLLVGNNKQRSAMYTSESGSVEPKNLRTYLLNWLLRIFPAIDDDEDLDGADGYATEGDDDGDDGGDGGAMHVAPAAPAPVPWRAQTSTDRAVAVAKRFVERIGYRSRAVWHDKCRDFTYAFMHSLHTPWKFDSTSEKMNDGSLCAVGAIETNIAHVIEVAGIAQLGTLHDAATLRSDYAASLDLLYVVGIRPSNIKWIARARGAEQGEWPRTYVCARDASTVRAILKNTPLLDTHRIHMSMRAYAPIVSGDMVVFRTSDGLDALTPVIMAM